MQRAGYGHLEAFNPHIDVKALSCVDMTSCSWRCSSGAPSDCIRLVHRCMKTNKTLFERSNTSDGEVNPAGMRLSPRAIWKDERSFPAAE